MGKRYICFLLVFIGWLAAAEPQTVRPLLCTDGDTFIAAPDSVV